MSTKVKTLDFITPVAISDTAISKPKMYRDILKAHLILKEKFNMSVNEKLYNEMVKKDNQNNPKWD